MKYSYKLSYLLFILAVINCSCQKDNNIDTEKPQIDNTFEEAFPKSCDTIYFGESFTLRLRLSDNYELGSYSFDIHHNFDRHTHSTEVENCKPDPIKEPVNPLTYIDDFSIPEGSKEYETEVVIPILSSNSDGDFDEGDYHFFISLTDKQGWSNFKGLSVKILHR